MSRKFVPVKVPTRKKEAVQQDDQNSNPDLHNQHPERAGKGSIKKGEKAVQFKDQGRGIDMEEDDFKFEVKNKQTVALELLEEGFSQSYIDFFYITSNTMPEVIQPSAEYKENSEKSKTRKRILGETENELIDLKNLLTAAEPFLRTDKGVAVDEYSRIADFFYSDKLNDFQTAAYFYKRCLSLAKSIQDPKWECNAMLGLGKCFAKLGRLDKAIEFYENIQKKADENQLNSIVIQASRELIEIYDKMAERYMQNNEEENPDKALYFLEKCLQAAELSRDTEKEAAVCHKIGAIHVKKKDFEKALTYQNKNLVINRPDDREKDNKKNVINLIEAHASIAKSYMALGKIDDALKHMQDYLETSKQNRKQNYSADAAFHLARLYAMKGNNQKSIEFYQQHFESARNEKVNKDRRLIDKARVYLGMAKANMGIDNYLKIVTQSAQNIKPLLEWKAKKDK